MVCGRRDVDLELFDMLRKLATRVEAIELVQDHGRHPDDVDNNEHDSFWDDLHERIDNLEESNFSWHLRIRKKLVWSVKVIMKRRKQIVEVHDDSTKVDEVSFGFHEQMDRSNIEIAQHLVVHNEIVEEENFTYVGKELDVAIIQDDVNDEMDVIGDLSIPFIVDLELHIPFVMDVINLDVSCGKKMDLLSANVVEGFKYAIELDLQDFVVANIDLNLYVTVEILKDMDVITDVDINDAYNFHVVGEMNIFTIFITIMDMSSYVVSDWVCDLDIVVDLVFMYEDDFDNESQIEHCYFQLSLYVDWMNEILIFESMKHRCLIFIFDLFSLMD